ncbi:MAG: ChbG/HpnK family deacetylase [Deltaproteobacteria bacterium]|nr:ChbG/HpnK family deacetylase [Deltaproteobacteria bacterium]
MKKLILHADDYGFAPSISDGILKAYEFGLLKSASALVNFPCSQTYLNKAKETKLDLGWHLNLSLGLPLSAPKKIPSLVDHKGSFFSLKKLLLKSFLGLLDKKELELELRAQLKFLQTHYGPVSHVDGHQHIHVFPGIRETLKKILLEEKIPYLRLPREVNFFQGKRKLTRLFLALQKGSGSLFWKETKVQSPAFYGLGLGKDSHSLHAWTKLLSTIHKDCAEVMLHPGFLNKGENLYGDDFPGNREAELECLLSASFKELIATKNFECRSFRLLLEP